MRMDSHLKSLLFSPGEPRLRAGWRLLLHFLLLIFFAILIGVPILLWLAPGGQIDEDNFFLANTLGLVLPVTAATYIARRWLDRRSFASLGLELNTRAVRDLLFGIGLAGLIMGLIFVSLWSTGWLVIEGFAWQALPASEILQALLFTLFVFVGVGWGEELLFRGYYLQNLAEGLDIGWAVGISSFLFALAHSFNPNVTWIAILGLLAAGFFFAYSYLRTRQLWMAIGLHIGWNFFEGSIFGFQVSGLDVFRLIRHSVTGPEIITGGVFGPEAGLILLPGLALGAVLIYGYTNRSYLTMRNDGINANNPD